MLIAVSILFALTGAFSLRLAGFNYIGQQPHPLAFPIGMQIFLVTVPGTLAIGLFGIPLLYDLQNEIAQSTMRYGVISTMTSIGILLWMLAVAFRTRFFVHVQYRKTETDISTLRVLTIASAFILVIKLVSVSEIPLLLALKGDVQGAAEAKVRILTNQDGITVFGLNYIFRSFTSVVYLISVSLVAYDPHNRAKRVVLFWNLPLMILNAVYDVQKYTLVLLMLLTFWVLYTRTGRFRYIIIGALLGLALSLLMFVVTLGYDFDPTLLQSTMYRLFVGQMEGMFYIYEFLRPSPDYAWLGLPLAPLFGVPQLDPAAEVVKILFPNAGDTWLNANTYYLAHAWTIFGPLSVLIGPVMVMLNLIVMLRLAQPLVRQAPQYYLPLLLWQLARLPLINIFTEFLYFKVALDFAVNLAFVWLVLQIAKRCTAYQSRLRSH